MPRTYSISKFLDIVYLYLYGSIFIYFVTKTLRICWTPKLFCRIGFLPNQSFCRSCFV